MAIIPFIWASLLAVLFISAAWNAYKQRRTRNFRWLQLGIREVLLLVVSAGVFLSVVSDGGFLEIALYLGFAVPLGIVLVWLVMSDLRHRRTPHVASQRSLPETMPDIHNSGEGNNKPDRAAPAANQLAANQLSDAAAPQQSASEN